MFSTHVWMCICLDLDFYYYSKFGQIHTHKKTAWLLWSFSGFPHRFPLCPPPPPIRKTVQGPEKRPSQGPKNDRNDPEKIPSPRHTYSKHILQKNWSKMIICGLSSGQTNLHPPIWGHGRQLDDRHRNPNINIREIILLGNQLGHPLPKLAKRRKPNREIIFWQYGQTKCHNNIQAACYECF